MKWNLIVVSWLCILVPSALFGQSPGEYDQQDTPMFHRRITIEENHQFSYRYLHCTGVGVGKGSFQQKGNRFFLHFRDLTGLEMPQSTGSWQPGPVRPKRPIQYRFQLFDLESGDTFPFAKVEFLNEEGTVVNGIYSDDDGLGTIDFPREELPDSLRITAIGFTSFSAPVSQTESQDWKVYLSATGFEYPIPVHTEEYEYRGLLNNGFKIRMLSPNDDSEWEVYRKVK